MSKNGTSTSGAWVDAHSGNQAERLALPIKPLPLSCRLAGGQVLKENPRIIPTAELFGGLGHNPVHGILDGNAEHARFRIEIAGLFVQQGLLFSQLGFALFTDL